MVAQNAEACVFWKLTFNRDFRSTEFQEIKINSCPASAASWGQCLLRGALGTQESFEWKSSSRLPGLCPTTTHSIPKQAAWAHSCFPLHVYVTSSNCFSYTLLAELLQTIIIIAGTCEGTLNSLPGVLGTAGTQPLSPTAAHPAVCIGGRSSHLHLWLQGEAGETRITTQVSHPTDHVAIRVLETLSCGQCLNCHNKRANVVNTKCSRLCSKTNYDLEKILISQALFSAALWLTLFKNVRTPYRTPGHETGIARFSVRYVRTTQSNITNTPHTTWSIFLTTKILSIVNGQMRIHCARLYLVLYFHLPYPLLKKTAYNRQMLIVGKEHYLCLVQKKRYTGLSEASIHLSYL